MFFSSISFSSISIKLAFTLFFSIYDSTTYEFGEKLKYSVFMKIYEWLFFMVLMIPEFGLYYEDNYEYCNQILFKASQNVSDTN